ncbi:coiled-coil domain-containing protein 115 [Gouania willdenowi]|uniref:Vacuolar ATPase assembly protein VMA22 n=1 Tax=Gouania willdenowi TaxID=441366 RepID=A0A8C5D666_GOUWI|nr:coiled-coil domain-containing protein 115 [Gouania willdenowi]
MGSPEVEEASLSLDEKLLRFMDQLELMQEKRVALNALIEQGWISMSSARYSMGSKHVSALQYASEMDPLVCVEVSTSDSGDVQFFTERTTQTCSNVCEPAPTAIEEIGPQEQGVRRRNISKKDVPTKDKSDGTIREKTSEVNLTKTNEHSPQQDPLKWFGILVPQSLKQAQSSFKQVIELSAEIASLQTAILRTRQELKISLTNENAVIRLSSSVGEEIKSI